MSGAHVEPKADVSVVDVGTSSAVQAPMEVSVQDVREVDTPSTSASIRRVSAWTLQMGASSCWVVSVFIYDSWETGDIFQMLAASLWTLSNVLALPDVLSR